MTVQRVAAVRTGRSVRRRVLRAELRRAGRRGGARAALLSACGVAALVGAGICVGLRLASSGDASALEVVPAALTGSVFIGSVLIALVMGGTTARDSASGLLQGARGAVPDGMVLLFGRASAAVVLGCASGAVVGLAVGAVGTSSSGTSALPGLAAAVPATALTGGCMSVIGFGTGVVTRRAAATQLTLTGVYLVAPLVFGFAVPLVTGPLSVVLRILERILPSSALGAATSYGSPSTVAAGLSGLVLWSAGVMALAVLGERRRSS